MRVTITFVLTALCAATRLCAPTPAQAEPLTLVPTQPVAEAYEPPLLSLGLGVVTQLPEPGVIIGASLHAHLYLPYLLDGRAQFNYGLSLDASDDGSDVEVGAGWSADVTAGFPLLSWTSVGTGEHVTGYSYPTTTYLKLDVPSRDMLLVEAGAFTLTLPINDPDRPLEEDDVWGTNTIERLAWLSAGLRYQTTLHARLVDAPPLFGDTVREINGIWAHVIFASWGLPGQESLELNGDPIERNRLGWRVGAETSAIAIFPLPTTIELLHLPEPAIYMFHLTTRWDFVRLSDNRVMDPPS